MTLRTITKTGALALCLWTLWVAWEWRSTISELTAEVPPPRPVMKENLAMASLAGPIGLPSRLDEGERSVLPASEIPATEIPKNLSVTSNEAAEKYLAEKRREWGVRDYHELRAQTYESPLGTKVKYSAFQDGLPIIGSEIVLEVTKDTKDVSVAENSYQPLEKVDTRQRTLDYGVILEKNPGRYKIDLTVTTGVSKVLFVAPGSDRPELSYVMAVKENGNGPTENLVFRATDGMVLGRQTARSEF